MPQSTGMLLAFAAVIMLIAFLTTVSIRRRTRRAFRAHVRKSTRSVHDKNVRLIDRNEELATENDLLRARNQELETLNVRLEQMANVDSMMGIPNRRAFDRRFDEEWRRSMRSGQPLSVLIVDVDSFKSFNDTYGHVEGDGILRRIAQSMGETLRISDFIARHGGEEFAVLLPDTEADGVLAVAEKLRSAVEALRIPHQKSATGQVVTVSVGAAWEVAATDVTKEKLLRRADVALYKAKEHGRNRVESISVT